MKQNLKNWGGLIGAALLVGVWLFRWVPDTSVIHGIPYASHLVHLDSVWQFPDSTISVNYTQDGQALGMRNISRKQFDSLISIP